MANSPKQVVAGKFFLVSVCRITRLHVGIVPEKLSYRNSIVLTRRPPTLPQYPGSKWILEAIHRICKTDVVFPLQKRELVVVIPCSRSVRKNFVQIRISVVMKERVATRRVVVADSATKFGQQRQRSVSDPL